MESKLTPLAKDGRPYRILAKEGLAFAKVAANNMTGARSDFVALSLLTDTPTDIRERSERMIALIDSGTATDLGRLATTLGAAESNFTGLVGVRGADGKVTPASMRWGFPPLVEIGRAHV